MLLSCVPEMPSALWTVLLCQCVTGRGSSCHGGGLPVGSDKWPRHWLCSAGGCCHGDMWGQPDPAHQCSGQLIVHRILMMCNDVLGKGELETKTCVCMSQRCAFCFCAVWAGPVSLSVSHKVWTIKTDVKILGHLLQGFSGWEAVRRRAYPPSYLCSVTAVLHS